MTTAYSNLLGLALPVTGELSGTWGDTVNDYITKYLDDAIANAQIISGSQTAVTLSKTTGASLVSAGSGATGSAQYALIRCTGNPASTLTITVDYSSLTNAQFSKTYLIFNSTSTSQSVVVRATTSSGTSTGVTITSGEKALIAWNGTDFVKIATQSGTGRFVTIEVTNIKANDGTASIVLTDSTGAVDMSKAVTMSATTQNIDLGTSQTSGTFTVGGAAQTGAQTFDQSTKTHTLNIGTGATENAATKTVNLATAGVSGSTTTMSVGSAVSGAITNLTVNATTTLAPVARSTGAVSYFTVTTPADTGLTASTEVIGSSFTAATRTWATGALTLQRERVFAAPTYAFAGASTLTTAVNVDIGLPVAGTNATITNAYALRAADSLFTGPTIVDVNSASAALRITQVGAGNALVVEDSANPDSTPFVVTAAGDVGVGTSSPGAKLDIVTSSTIAGVRVNNATAGKSAMVIQNNGSNVGIIGLTGYWNGNSDTNFGLFAETGSDIRFSTNGVAAPQAIIDTSGNLGIGTDTPVSALGFGQAASATGITFQSTSTTFNSGKAAVIKASISGSGNGALIFETYEGGSGGGERMRLTNTGTLNIVGAGTAGSTQAISFNGSTPVDTLVTDSSGRVGIGISSPAGVLNIKTSNGQFLVQNGTSAAQMRISAFNNAGNANAALIFEGYANEYGRFDTSGNLGLGVTPSAKLEIYSTNNAFNALQVRYNGSNDAMGFGIGNSNGFPYLGYNTKSQASVDAPVYERSNPAAQLRMDNGSFKFNIAPSGTANTTTITNDVSYTIITSGNQTDFGAANNNVGTSFTANASGTLSSGTVSQNISFNQAMTLDASGRLLVGLTADTAAGGYFGIIQAQGSYPAIVLKGTETSAKTWQIGENAGSLAFYNTTDGERARITSGGDFRVKGAGTAGSTEAFQVSGSAPADAARLDSNGNLLVGTTTSSAKVSLQYSGASAIGQDINDADDQANSTFVQFRVQGTQAGTIKRVASTSAVVYNTTSDYRLKNVVGAVTGQGSRIDALKPIDYQWKQGNTPARGFLAHEFQEVYPSSVSGTKDAVDAEGKPVYQAMQASTSEVIADLVAELQSLRARVAQLEQGV